MSSPSIVDRDEKLIWNPAFRVERLDEQTLFLFSEHEKCVLKGSVVCTLEPFISSGDCSADQIAGALEGVIAFEEVYFALNELEKKGWIQANLCLFPLQMAAYCGLLHISEQDAHSRLKETKVYVEGEKGLIQSLQQLSIQLVETIDQADFSVISVYDYLELKSLPDRNRSWLLCKPYGSEIWVGPLFEPSNRSCYQCLAKAIKINRLEETHIQKKLGLDNLFPPFWAMLETTKQLAWNWVATEVLKHILLRKSEHLEGKIVTFNTIDGKQQFHHVLKRALCSCCGQNACDPTHPTLVLQKRKKEEGLRAFSAEETLKRFSNHVSPITGLVKYLEPASDEGRLHVYFSGYNMALPSDETGYNINTFRSATGGKGLTESAAKASGLCEALERASGHFFGDEKHIFATYSEIKGEAVHPDAVQLFSQNQYQHREKLNVCAHSFWKVAHPFPEDREIAWTPLFSLTENRIKYYPLSCCYYKVPEERGGWKGHSDSNGCAAGNCLEEAILQGFLELIERDSIAIWWYNALEYPEVDLASFGNPHIENILDTYEARHRDVWVLDITSDLSIPSFVALSSLKNGNTENIYMGFGSHLDAESALLRALTELNQFLGAPAFWETSCFGDGKQEMIDKKIVADWMNLTKVKDHPYLRGHLPLKKASEYHKWQTADLLEDIHYCRHVVEERGMEFLVLDQTRAEVGLNVVRVIVPGLRHFWPRFAPGRLFDVPVKMGKLAAPLKENQLNPVGIFL